MTVLVDTYELPAHIIMTQLYKTMCYEVMLEEVLSRSYNAPKEGKKYTVLEDISPKTLIAMRDIENVIYVFHNEMLSDKEYKMVKYYTNELIYVENNTIKIINKKTKKQETYMVEKTKGPCHMVVHRINKISEDAEKVEKEFFTEKQKQSKYEVLPFLRVQALEEVYFPEEESDFFEENEM